MILCSDILKLIKSWYSLIVKPDLLEKCESYLGVRRIDLDDKESPKPKDRYKDWAYCKIVKSQFRNWGKVMKSEILMLLLFVINIVTTLKRLFEKRVLLANVVKNASISNPHTLRNDKVAVVQRRLNLLLIAKDLINSTVLWNDENV